MKALVTKIGCLFAIVITLTNCSPDSSKPIINENDMSEIVAEYFVMHAYLAQFNTPIGNERRGYYYNNILIKHGYTEADFDSSLVWYTNHFDSMEKVYTKAASIIKEEQKNIKEAIGNLPADSISNDNDLDTTLLSQDTRTQTPLITNDSITKN